MYQAQLVKFSAPGEPQRQLLATGTRRLISINPWDKFWGTGQGGEGRNEMGKILSKIRSVLTERAVAAGEGCDTAHDSAASSGSWGARPPSDGDEGRRGMAESGCDPSRSGGNGGGGGSGGGGGAGGGCGGITRELTYVSTPSRWLWEAPQLWLVHGFSQPSLLNPPHLGSAVHSLSSAAMSQGGAETEA